MRSGVDVVWGGSKVRSRASIWASPLKPQGGVGLRELCDSITMGMWKRNNIIAVML